MAVGLITKRFLHNKKRKHVKTIKSFVLALTLVFTLGAALGSAACFVAGEVQLGTELAAVAGVSYCVGNWQVMPTASINLGLQFSRTEENLINFLRGDKADLSLVQKYLDGKLRFRDVILYKSILVDGFSGIQKVWDGTVAKAAGVTNVDRAKLDKDVTVCIDTILIGYANSGGAGTDPSNIASYDHVVTSWPAGLVNAEITIKQDSNTILEDLPVRCCGSMADSTFGVGRAEGLLLKNPFILEGDKSFEVLINFPQAIGVANTDFIRIDLLGVGTRKRGMV